MENYNEEIWKDIVGYEGLYQVSNYGRIKRLSGFYFCGHRNQDKRIINETIMSFSKNQKGYFALRLSKDGERKGYLVHRLVWITFNGSIPEGMQVNHINEIKTDNRLCNLNLMTPKENVNWGTRNIRVANSLTDNTKKTKSVNQLDINGNFLKKWNSFKEIENTLGYSKTLICRLCRGKGNSAYGYKWEYAD